MAGTIHLRGPPIKGSEELLKIVKALGVRLEPMHPGTNDPNLMNYFIVEVPDSETAKSVIDHLQHIVGIDSVYIKPPDEQP